MSFIKERPQAYQVQNNPVSITLVNSPYTVPDNISEVNVNTAGGNVRVNLPSITRQIKVNKTSGDSYLVTLYVSGTQIGEIAGERSSVTIESGQITKDEPWYPYDVIIRVAGLPGDGGEVLAKNKFGKCPSSSWRGTAGSATVPGTNADIINTVIEAIGSGKRLLIGDDHVLDDDVHLNALSNIQLDFNGLMSLSNTYAQTAYVGYYDGYYAGVMLLDCNNILLNGINLNGNKANVPREITGSLIIKNSSSIRLQNGTLSNASYKALDLVGGTVDISVEKINFMNNCDTVSADSDIYVSCITGKATFKDCTFSRAALSDSGAQAFYVDAPGMFLYINNKFTNISAAYDFRQGLHEIIGSSGDTVGNVLLTNSGATTPKVKASGLVFSNIYGQAGFVTSAIQIGYGVAEIRNSKLIAKTGGSAYYGILVRHSTSKNCIISNNYIEAFSVAGMFLNTTSGGHLFERNEIVGTSTDGFRSVSNTAKSLCVDNFFGVGVTNKYTNTDGMMIISGDIGNYITKSSGSSTGTGSEQTIAHGLAAIPRGCKAWIKYLVGSRYITEMIPFDATNVYPTVTSGLAYEWRIE